MPETKIEYKLDFEALTKNNSRELLKKFLGKQLTTWETTKKDWRK